MRKFIIVLSIIILLAMLPPYFSIIAQPTHTPHENPTFAKDSPDPISLLFFYGDVYDLIANELFTEAISMLTELETANTLDKLQYLIDRFSTLSHRLITTMDHTRLLIDEILALIDDCQDCSTEQMVLFPASRGFIRQPLTFESRVELPLVINPRVYWI